MSDSPHLLVLEDQEDARQLLTWTLERAGCRVTAVSNATDAVTILKQGRLDGVVLDWMLTTGTTGADVALVAFSEQPPVPACIVSAVADSDLLSEELHGLPIPVLAKPVTAEETLDALGLTAPD